MSKLFVGGGSTCLKKKLVGLATAATLSGVAVFAPLAGLAQTVDTAALIAQLQAQIAALQAQLAALSGGAPSGSVSCNFTRDLQVGSTGDDVKCLQQYLNASGYKVASSGVGSPGNETTYFGGLTKAAVAAWQAAKGISPAAGYFGPKSRAAYSQMAGAQGTQGAQAPQGAPVAGAGLAVSAGAQPDATLAPEKASRIPFTRVVLTAGSSDVTVDGITVERTGLGADAVFSGIVLLDENGQQLGIAKTLNSVHQATVGDPFVVKAGTSKTVTIAGNMPSSLDSYAGQVVRLAVVKVNTAATVTGALPITGTGHTINATLAVGSVTVDRGSLDPNVNANKEIGTTGYTFQSVKVTAGSEEKIRLWSVRWNQAGSASAGDLANVKVYVDGTAYDTTVSSDGKYYTASFGSGIVIDKGLSKEVSIKGDIVGGAARTIRFDIYKDTDIYATGETYGYGLIASAGSTSAASDNSSEFTTGTPFYDGAKVTIDAGTVTTVAKANSVAAQNIAVNVLGQPLGGFDVEIKGEPISVQKLVFWATIASPGKSVANLTNVSLQKADGTVVAGPVDGAAEGSITFTDTVTFPTGKTTYKLVGKVGTALVDGNTIQASTTPSSDWTTATGQTTGNTISLSALSTAITMNTMTVRAATTTVTVSGNPASQNVVMGQVGFKFATYQFDATASGEDVKVSSAQFYYETDTGSSNVTNCFAYDGATKLNSSAVNPTSDGNKTFTFDTNLVITKGTVKNVDLKCDIPSSLTANDTVEWKLAASATLEGVGIGSGNTITLTHLNSTDNQNKMTLKSNGSLTFAKDSSSPSYALASAGASNVTLGVVKFTATDEAITLDRIALQLTAPAASTSVNDLTKVTLWDGATKVGEAIFTNTRFATSTLTGTFLIPKDTDKLLTIKGDLAAVGTSQVGTQGALILVDVDANDPTGTRGIGQSSGTTINHGASADTAMDGVRMFRSYPTVAKSALASNKLSNGTQTLLRFNVKADTAGDVGIYKFTFQVATTGATVTNLNVFGFIDSSFSSPVSGYTSGGQLSNADISGFASASDIDFVIKNSGGTATPLQIPAGATRYFEVRGTIGSADASGDQAQTQLQGDVAYPSLSTLMANAAAVDTDTNDDFIWSPNATTTSSVNHADWTNGYGVPGLPATNLSPETLSF